MKRLVVVLLTASLVLGGLLVGVPTRGATPAPRLRLKLVPR